MDNLPEGVDPIEVFLYTSKMMGIGFEEPRIEALENQESAGRVLAYLVRAASDPAERQKLRRELILRERIKGPQEFDRWFGNAVSLAKRKLREADGEVERIVLNRRVVRPSGPSNRRGRIWPKKHRK